MTHKNEYEYLITSELIDDVKKLKIIDGIDDLEMLDEILNQINMHIRYNLSKEAYYSYNSIIELFIKLINNLNINDLLSITTVYNYLVHNGFLSNDNLISFDNKNRINNFYMLGADVIRGNALCLNITSLFNDILNNMGYKTYSIVLDKMPNVFNLSKIKNNKRNIAHAITLINNKENIFLCDSSNLDFLSVDFNNELNYIYNNKKASINAFYTLIINNLSRKEMIELSCDIYNEDNSLYNFNVSEKINEAKNMCLENIPLFKDFHESIKEDISNVCKKLK